MTDSILELQDLYNETLVRQLIEKTKNCALTWSSVNSTTFHASASDSNCNNPPSNICTWDYYVAKTQIGSVSYKYSLDVKKNLTAYVSLADGPLTYTQRDSVVKDLYDIVEMIVMQLDAKVKDAANFVTGIKGCAG